MRVARNATKPLLLTSFVLLGGLIYFQRESAKTASSLAEANKEIAALKADKKKVEADLAKNKLWTKDLEGTVNDTANKQSSLDEDLKAARKDVAAREETIKGLETRIAQAESARKKQDALVASLRADIDKRIAENNESSALRNDLEKQLELARTKSDLLKEQAVELESQIAALDKKLARKAYDEALVPPSYLTDDRLGVWERLGRLFGGSETPDPAQERW